MPPLMERRMFGRLNCVDDFAPWGRTSDETERGFN
jgi:hypothetical protein